MLVWKRGNNLLKAQVGLGAKLFFNHRRSLDRGRCVVAQAGAAGSRPPRTRGIELTLRHRRLLRRLPEPRRADLHRLPPPPRLPHRHRASFRAHHVRRAGRVLLDRRRDTTAFSTSPTRASTSTRRPIEVGASAHGIALEQLTTTRTTSTFAAHVPASERRGYSACSRSWCAAAPCRLYAGPAASRR